MHLLWCERTQPHAGLLPADGGSKAFATDVPPKTKPLDLQGFGHVLEYPDVTLERLTEEHGMLAVNADHDLKVGDTVHVIPNHICSTVNLHDAVYMVDGHGAVEELQVSARGKIW